MRLVFGMWGPLAVLCLGTMLLDQRPFIAVPIIAAAFGCQFAANKLLTGDWI